MKCNECYWCALDSALSNERVCCNQESKNYNKIFTEEETETMDCEDAETKQAVDYRNMTPWEFASRYYM